MRILRISLFVLLVQAGAIACSESTSPGNGSDAGADAGGGLDAGTVDASTPDAATADASTPSCDDVVCGTNSTCSTSSGSPLCACDPGFQDHDGNGSCTADCTGITCSGHGQCEDASGTATCICTGGYEGVACEACGSGLQDNDDDGSCAPVCTPSTCGDHGTCDDASGLAVCTCSVGYDGADCSTCGPGYQDRDGDGACSIACATDSCNEVGVCDDASGVATCTCDLGYQGAACDACDADYQDNDADGTCAPRCAITPCFTNETCDDSGGEAICLCSPGYQDLDDDGLCLPSCAIQCTSNGVCDDSSGTVVCTCDTDYQLHAGNVSCEPTCAITTCGANATCADVGGRAVCGCDAGTSDVDQDGNCSPSCSVYGGSASAGPGSTTSDPSAAFDGNFNSQFNAITSSVNYLTYDYGVSASPVIVSYTLYSYGYSASEVFGFELLGSADGTSWTTLDTRNTTLPNGAPPKRFTFANSTGYRYYRLHFFNTAGGFVRVQEVSLNSCD